MAEAPPNTVFAEVWGWTFVALLFQLTWWLHAIVPAAGGARTAYVTDPATHAPLRYQTNALRVMLIVTATAAAAVHFQLMGASDLATHYWPAARAAFFFGGCASVMLYTRGAKVLRQGKLDKGTSCTTIAGARSAAAASTEEFDNLSALEHFFCGYEWNPRGVSTGIDLKMFCYSFGAILLWLNVLSKAALQYEQEPKGSSKAMIVYTGCMSWFLLEYMFFEHVHLYTYDIFRERLGFKIVWGCFSWYPFFYQIGNVVLVEAEKDLTVAECAGCAAVFAVGWVLTRGANMQKHALKSGATTFLGAKLNTVPGSNGRLLCSGWWSLSRHINYAGEIIQAVALALPGYMTTGSVIPWLYPLYYVALFVPRELDDDQVCKLKYGEVWETYKKLVPYRIIPYVY